MKEYKWETKHRNLVLELRRALELNNCTDGSCRLKLPEDMQGMHTNGGCKCIYNLKYSLKRLKEYEGKKLS